MESAGDRQSEAGLVAAVDGALESLWRGDPAAFDRLLDPNDDAAGGLGAALGEALGAVEGAPADGDLEIAGYEVRREIGRGGMGVVYEAVSVETGRTVAVKVLRAGPSASEHAERRFRREVDLGARLVHPNIVPILDSGRLPSGQAFHVMERVDGLTLAHFLRAARPEVREVLALFLTLCEAVGHAHRNGVVHRDLKPANVLVDAEGVPHVVDFGLAKAVERPEVDGLAMSVSEPGQIVGTLRYLAPEQASGRTDEIDARMDVYALGLMLYEALTGTFPFDLEGSPSEIVERIVHAAPPRPTSRSDRVDHALETIVLKAMEKSPERRYRSAGELGVDLRRYVSGEHTLVDARRCLPCRHPAARVDPPDTLGA